MKEIRTQIVYAHRQSTSGLDRIRMKWNRMFTGNFPDVFHRLNRANFIVGVHH